MSAAPVPGAEPDVTFRVATESDVPAIADLYASLSRQSSRMRFFGSMPQESLEAAAQLDDGQDSLAVVALAHEHLVGEARYLMHGDGEYELGITVADRCQRQGVGRRLLDHLRREAAAHGVDRLLAVVRADNVAMLKTLRSIGSAVVEPVDDMVVVVEVSCVDGMPGWPARTAGRRVLVEFNSFWEAPETGPLRQAGFEVRQCLGPKRGTGQTCPLVLTGRCRLAQEADVIACLLSDADPNFREVAERHACEHPTRLTARSGREWELAAGRLLRP